MTTPDWTGALRDLHHQQTQRTKEGRLMPKIRGGEARAAARASRHHFDSTPKGA